MCIARNSERDAHTAEGTGKERNSMAERTERKTGRHIIQYPADVSLCAGCSGCEIVCGLLHDGVSGPSVRRLFVKKDPVQMIHKVYTCQHCVDHPCYNACPKKDKAMCLDAESGVVYVNPEECVGCNLCVRACPFEPKRIQLGPGKIAVKCDLCRDRPEGPACVECCQVMCLGLSDEPVPGEV